MPDLKVLAEQVVAFRDERDWKQFHNPKDVALSLMLESAELLEHFQWKNGEAIQETAMHRRAELADELADVLYYTLLMAHDLNIDLSTALTKKLAKNAEKYPTEKAKGSNKKYTEL
ncbi:nucleotide pyrophosphohydrolase [Caenimonas soli]|uniref:nucleotide pyrophosphohydrolase n=1 Tax=Caenimonas soli TaxID=2735555 RepID=UPI0015544C12|nr:nucleotide pyrophosphohydrolase [Caenimonas soli]NPC54272.1 nucleotide pyrophosphohydrolase [Caenimonas soli]